MVQAALHRFVFSILTWLGKSGVIA